MSRGRARLSLRYATRSLRRGGQRTLLAIFCIAVGVMAVVGLRLAGGMITLSLTGNIREINGGDVALQSTGLPLTHADLAKLDALRAGGTIDDYLALGVSRATVRRGDGGHLVSSTLFSVDDPSRYPLVGAPDLVAPQGTSFATLLQAPDSVVLSQFVADQLLVDVGSSVHVTVVGGSGADLRVTGILQTRFSAAGVTQAYVTGRTQQQLSTQDPSYGIVDASTGGDATRADAAATALRQDFPQATVLTVQELLDQNQEAASQISSFLEIVGLLALLIGGIGIVNTMQVTLSRRRVEIAMLKTVGYRRRDLYALFGVEAALLGLLGGALGTALGVALSALLRVLVQRALFIHVVFSVDPGALWIGMAVGVATALIFGLLPIVRSSEVRPAAVLRDMSEGVRVGTVALSAGLYVLLVALFTALSAGLLGSVPLAVIVVVATGLALSLLAAVFAGIVWIVGLLPVPERPTLPFLLLVTGAVLVAARIAMAAHAVGAVLLVVAVAGYGVALLPRRRKTGLLLALRSLRRTRARTATTLVALFTGVFTVGYILVLGQDLSNKFDESINQLSNYNLVAIASPHDASRLRSAAAHLSGLQQSVSTMDIMVTPATVNGRPLTDYVPPPQPAQSGRPREGNQFRFSSLSGVEGYDLQGGDRPDVPVLTGRPLDATDAGTAGVLLRSDLQRQPFFLQVGDTVRVRQSQTGTVADLTVVGFYSPFSVGSGGLRFRFNAQPILGDASLATRLGGATTQTVISMKIDPGSTEDAVRTLERAAPDVSVFDVADIASLIRQILSALVVFLVAIASLALFAGVVIMGNTVALAMLERRRELGILKAVGHSSRSVLAQVLVENGIVGGIGAVSGMAVVTILASALGQTLFKVDLVVGTPIALAVIGGVVALTTATAALVAYAPTRIRPLEVLRYE